VANPYTTPNGDTYNVPLANTGSTYLYEGGRVLFYARGTGLSVDNLTVQNTHNKSTGTAHNAEALFFDADSGTFMSRDSNWISRQGTLELKGQTWFYNSLIAGDAEFIWGTARVALFENSELRTRVDPLSASGGNSVVQSKITAAATAYPGFIFLGSYFTAEAEVPAASTYLAKVGGGTVLDYEVFTGCTIGSHIKPVGFNGTSIPVTGTPVAGLRYYDLQVEGGGSWDTSGLSTGFRLLTGAENTGLYGARATIYGSTTAASFTVTDGTNSYTSIGWPLSTTY
jgi:pectate lyase